MFQEVWQRVLSQLSSVNTICVLLKKNSVICISDCFEYDPGPRSQMLWVQLRSTGSTWSISNLLVSCIWSSRSEPCWSSPSSPAGGILSTYSWQYDYDYDYDYDYHHFHHHRHHRHHHYFYDYRYILLLQKSKVFKYAS